MSAAGERAREVQRAQGADEFAAGDRSPSRPGASSTYRLIIGDRSDRTTPRVTGLFPSRVPEHPDDGRLAVQSRRDSASGCPCGHHGRLRFGPASSRLRVALVSLERRAGKWTPSLWHPFSPPPKPSTYLSFDIVRVRSPGVCRTHASPVRRVSAARRRTRCPAPCCRRVLGRLSGRRGCRRRRRWPTGIYRAGVPGLSHLRCAGARLRSSAVRGVRVRAARAVLVQGPRLLPQLRRAAHE